MKINSFVCGLIAGVGIGYLLSGSDPEELIEEMETHVDAAKKVVNDGIRKGKKR